MASLDRALALAEVHERAVEVAEHLELHVPRLDDVALEQHGVVAERGERLAPRAREQLVEPREVLDDAHAAPAAARARLHEQRHADRRRLRAQPLVALVRPVVARHDGDARLARAALRLDLRAHRRDRRGRRPDEDEPRVDARLREVRALGEEAVARVHAVGAERLGRRHHALDVEVRPGRGSRPDAQRRVHRLAEHRAGIGVAVDADGHDAKLARAARDADRDLAAVRDEQPAQPHHIRNTPKRVSAGGAQRAASRPSASTARVSSGAMTPSSQSRALL